MEHWLDSFALMNLLSAELLFILATWEGLHLG